MNGAVSIERSSAPRISIPWVDDFMRGRLFALLGRLEGGTVTVREGGRSWTFGTPGDLEADVTVHDPRVYRALADGSVGVADAYVRGDWRSSDLPALVRMLARNAEVLSALDSGAARLAEVARRALRVGRSSSRRDCRRDIAAHYDLSNDLFATFLDPTMTYSSALFPSPEATLEEAQIAKLDAICQKLRLEPSDHLLEIGTGWGSLAIHAARTYGCRVTTTTISKEQLALATERVRAEGLSDRVTLLGADYRDLRGTFSKLASIEMIEAVGHRDLPRYFRACAERLCPGGRMVLQAITISELRHARHLTSQDFIKARVFPGSSIPSLASIVAASERAGMCARGLQDLTAHYARTLAEWRKRLLQGRERIFALGFDEAFLRRWEYYLAYCEGAFAERYIGVHQVELGRP